MKFSTSKKIFEERYEHKVYCSCGHSVVIFPFEHKNKKVCSYCGKYVYKDKKEEFKERLGALL